MNRINIMKKKSVFFIVGFSLFIGLLHFILGPDYNGIFKEFVRGYLIDLLLPMNLYLLLQISLRKKLSIGKSRTIAAVFIFLFGVTVEILQMFKIRKPQKTMFFQIILIQCNG